MPSEIARALRLGRWLFRVASVISLLGLGFDLLSYAQTGPQPVAPFIEANCPTSTAPLHLGGDEGSIPSGFVPVRAIRCHVEYLANVYRVTEQSAPVTKSVLPALARPDAAAWPGMACSAVGRAPGPYLLLVDSSGRAVRPHLPSKPCGGQRSGTVAAIARLHYGPATTYDLRDP